MQLKIPLDTSERGDRDRDALSQVVHRKVDQLPDHG